MGEQSDLRRGIPTPEDFAVYRAMVANSLDGMLLTDPDDGKILVANPAACSLLRASEAEICALGGGSFIDTHDARWKDAVIVRQSSGEVRAELPMIRNDGSLFVAEIASRIFTTPLGERRAVLAFRDVSERSATAYAYERRIAALEELARTDSLTGVLSRRGLLEAGEELVGIADRLGETIHVLFVDMDCLKEINDREGHRAGDLALIMVADALRGTARSTDAVGRLGGDEFGVFTIGSTTAGMHVLLARIHELLIRVDGGRVTISTGIAQREPGVGQTIHEVLHAADKSMYEGRHGRAEVVRLQQPTD